MKVELIGAPFDRCGRHPGSALGPDAIRFVLEREVRSEQSAWIKQWIGESLVDLGNVEWRTEPEVGGLKGFPEAMSFYEALQKMTYESISKGNVPLVIGGDHSLSIGTVSGAAKAISERGGKLGLLWIDAHADLNTPVGSPSGNVHGMPIAALLGTKDTVSASPISEQWSGLIQKFAAPALSESQVAWIGLRDVDAAESDRIASYSGCFASTMQDIDRHGIGPVMEAFWTWAERQGITDLYISFDVDSLDPVLAPGTGTAVRGGLSYREGHMLAEFLADRLRDDGVNLRLAGLDVVEVNPMMDSANATAKVAIEWVASLFGKRILSKRPEIGF